MNIYIYGNKSFKKEIHNVLNHSNIKFKLDDDSVIEDIESLDQLKETISQSPNDIYLIDEEKIIKNNSINSKVKFLSPKDAIDENFLLEHSIPDVTLDSLKELPKYIIKKHDEYLEKIENETIQNEIIDIVDEAYQEDKKALSNSEDNEEIIDDELSDLLVSDETIDDFSNDEFNDYKFSQNIDTEDNINIQSDETKTKKSQELNQDDFLSELEELDDTNKENETVDEESLIQIEESFESEFANIEDLMDDENNDIKQDDNLNLDELESLIDDKDEEDSIDSEIDELDSFFAEELEENENIEEKIEENKDNILDEDIIKDEIDNNSLDFEELEEKIEPSSLGEKKMNDDFSQLDQLNEADLLEALGDIPARAPVKNSPAPKAKISQSTNSATQMEMSSESFAELSKIFSQLLKDKTVEITIKIKD